MRGTGKLSSSHNYERLHAIKTAEQHTLNRANKLQQEYLKEGTKTIHIQKNKDTDWPCTH